MTAPQMPEDFPRRTVIGGLASAGLMLALAGCESEGPGSGTSPLGPSPQPAPAPTPSPTASPIPASRSWRMGFSTAPPRPTVAAVVQGVDTWSARAELSLVHEELPWADLLAGMTPAAILARDKVELVSYLRSKGLRFALMLDLTNGLAREAEAPALVRAGRSLTEPAVQALARSYALEVETTLRPDWLGLAAETNLIRQIAPPALYQAVKSVTGGTEAALAAAGARSMRFVSVQAEAAWGRLGGNGSFVGIAEDLADFPFTKALGISSYPYLAYSDPGEIPPDYYSRIKGASGLPVIVTEGGWTSADLGKIVSSPAKQATYFAAHSALLDSVQATGYFQLLFADLDLAAFPAPQPASLPVFAALGLTNADFVPKPALAQWDALFARRWIG